MRQYLDLKAQVPDAILLFRLGDFYEMFFEDAVDASAALDIALTSRSKGDERIPMCGVPHHSARGYIAKLAAAGRKVALCEQIDDGARMMRREITRILTPGMVIEDELLDPLQSHRLAAIATAVDGALGVAFGICRPARCAPAEVKRGRCLARGALAPCAERNPAPGGIPLSTLLGTEFDFEGSRSQESTRPSEGGGRGPGEGVAARRPA